MKINNKGLALQWIFLIVALFFLFLFVIGYQNKTFISEAISTKPSDFTVDMFGQIKQVYEINPEALIKGLVINPEEKDALRIKYAEKDYTVIIYDVKEESVEMFFQGKGNVTIMFNRTYLVDLDRKGNPDIEMTINKGVSQNRKVQISLKRFEEKRLIPSGDYLELFDVTIRLANEKLYVDEPLQAFIIFENFGEGPSEIKIEYLIIGQGNQEVYHGFDTRIVQTEDRVTKTFDFLDLEEGRYIIRTDIFYGNNQTARAEQNFEVTEVPVDVLIKEPLLFIILIIMLFVGIFFIRRKYQ